MTTVATGTPLRVGQQDTIFRARILDDDGSAVDVSGAGTLELKFRDPAGTVTAQTAVFSTGDGHTGTGSDGWIEWKDTAGAATDSAGQWKYWGHVDAIGSDGPFFSTTLSYRVDPEGHG